MRYHEPVRDFQDCLCLMHFMNCDIDTIFSAWNRKCSHKPSSTNRKCYFPLNLTFERTFYRFDESHLWISWYTSNKYSFVKLTDFVSSWPKQKRSSLVVRDCGRHCCAAQRGGSVQFSCFSLREGVLPHYKEVIASFSAMFWIVLWMNQTIFSFFCHCTSSVAFSSISAIGCMIA